MVHKIYRTKGFVFKKEDRMDSDRVFSVFTKDFGKTEVFAKAIRKISSKLKGGINIFCVSEIEFIQGKNLKTLTDAIAISRFENILKLPEKMEIAYKTSDTLDAFIRGQEPDEKIWNSVLDFFEKIDSSFLPASNCQLAYYYFFWNFISTLGYKPELYQCSHCNKNLNPDKLYFSSKEGGLVCEACIRFNKDSKNINSDAVKALRLILKNDWQTILKLKMQKFSHDLLKATSEDYRNYILPGFSKNNLLAYHN